MRRSDLPFGSEFSPSQIKLRHVLELAKKHGGDWKAFEEAIRLTYFEKNQTTDYNKSKLANNSKLGMIAYGIIDRAANLTPFGERLHSIRQDEIALHQELARHILLNLHGITLVQCIQDIQAAGDTVDLIMLREELEQRGVHFPRGGKHPSMMRLWLEKAGVFITGYRVDEARLQEIIGTSLDDIDALSRLTREQKEYLKTLANMGEGTYPSNEVEKLATAVYGIKYNEKNLPKTVLYPLEKAGYITVQRSNRARSPMITATDKLDTELVLPLLKQFEQQVGTELRNLLRKPLTDILSELTAPDKHTRGLALEALAFKLMRLLDMTYVATRLRGTATGGAEVDLVFESSRLVFSRWQIQCKNTARVALDDVAKEVGLTHMLKSNVIVMVSTGEIGSEARRYANKVMQDSNLCIVMVDRADINTVERNPSAIVDVFNREAKNTMKLKALEAV